MNVARVHIHRDGSRNAAGGHHGPPDRQTTTVILFDLSEILYCRGIVQPSTNWRQPRWCQDPSRKFQGRRRGMQSSSNPLWVSYVVAVVVLSSSPSSSARLPPSCRYVVAVVVVVYSRPLGILCLCSVIAPLVLP